MISTARAIIYGTEKQQKVFNQSYEVKIMPLVIYGLRGIHTHAYLHESDLKKAGANWPAADAQCTPDLKINKQGHILHKYLLQWLAQM